VLAVVAVILVIVQPPPRTAHEQYINIFHFESFASSSSRGSS
jgi:hypothetical protein